jgi:kynureninase
MLRASLDVFDQTSMEQICRKQVLLTGYLQVLLEMHFRQAGMDHDGHGTGGINDPALPSMKILTPGNPLRRGSQLSISFSASLCAVQEELKANGIIVCNPAINANLLTCLFPPIVFPV